MLSYVPAQSEIYLALQTEEPCVDSTLTIEIVILDSSS